VGQEQDPLSLDSYLEELLGREISGSSLEIENKVVGIRRAYHVTPFYPQQLALTNFTDKQRSLDLYSSHVDSGHGVTYKTVLYRTSVTNENFAHEKI
jgi:hypothetical protein